MKKTSLLLMAILLLTIIFACSCNVDAQEGIFSEIASSVQDSGTQVKAYLGTADSYHYIQTDVGISKIDSSSSTTLIKSTADQQINQACLVDSNIYVLTSSTGTVGSNKVVKYSLTGEKETNEIKNVKWLTVNGAYYIDSTKTLGYVGSSTTVTLGSAVLQCLESEGYIFLSLEDKYVVYDVATLTEQLSVSIPSSLTSTNIIGYQVLTSSTTPSFLIVDANGYIYTLTSSAITKVEEIESTLASGNINSFYYNQDGIDYVVFKANSYFERLTINSSEYDIDTYSVTGYSTTLRSSLVSNIVPSSNTGKFIIATWKNSVWEIDPTTGEATDIM